MTHTHPLMYKCNCFKIVPKHPQDIYMKPESKLPLTLDGMVYFLKGLHIREFGFPRDEMVKDWKWKKMNFTTDLPKRKPYVTYVVASAMRAHLIEESENAEFRMHAVIPYCQGKNSS